MTGLDWDTTRERNPAVDACDGEQGDVAIRARGLRKVYGGVAAVAGIDVDVRLGEIFALLGPNGAGKTTTVEILEGYRQRDGGEVSVLGCDPGRERARLKPRIGIVLQSTGIEPYLTVRETVSMYAGFYPHPRPVDEVIELVGLTAKRRERVNRLSGGQQRRLDMAIGLAGDPDLLFLDEPTTGFDPSARREAWEVVKNLTLLGKTVVLTTHFMDEAQYLADRVAVIAAGTVIARGTPATLGFRDRTQVRVRYRLPHGIAPPAGLGDHAGSDGLIELRVDDPTIAMHDLTGWAIDHGLSLESLEVTRPSLEDVYLELTNGTTTPSTGDLR
jgi:ABC-2 type transport system ATP-binding protein